MARKEKEEEEEVEEEKEVEEEEEGELFCWAELTGRRSSSKER